MYPIQLKYILPRVTAQLVQWEWVLLMYNTYLIRREESTAKACPWTSPVEVGTAELYPTTPQVAVLDTELHHTPHVVKKRVIVRVYRSTHSVETSTLELYGTIKPEGKDITELYAIPYISSSEIRYR